MLKPLTCTSFSKHLNENQETYHICYHVIIFVIMLFQEAAEWSKIRVKWQKNTRNLTISGVFHA